MAEERIERIVETIVLVKKHSYGWDFYPVIARYHDLIHGYVVIDDRGQKSIVNYDDIYAYYLNDDIEEDRFYFMDDAIIRKMGERR